MLKKDARILFNCDSQRKITRLGVFKFTEETEASLRYLYQQFSDDFGNSERNWDQCDLTYVLIRLFVDHEFLHRDSRIDAIEQLRKIAEFREQIDSQIIYLGWI